MPFATIRPVLIGNNVASSVPESGNYTPEKGRKRKPKTRTELASLAIRGNFEIISPEPSPETSKTPQTPIQSALAAIKELGKKTERSDRYYKIDMAQFSTKEFGEIVAFGCANNVIII